MSYLALALDTLSAKREIREESELRGGRLGLFPGDARCEERELSEVRGRADDLCSHSSLNSLSHFLRRDGDEPVGVLLDESGAPSLPCATCGGLLFWAPADGPVEFGPWRCSACEPPEVPYHACALPAVEPETRQHELSAKQRAEARLADTLDRHVARCRPKLGFGPDELLITEEIEARFALLVRGLGFEPEQVIANRHHSPHEPGKIIRVMTRQEMEADDLAYVRMVLIRHARPASPVSP